MLGSFYDPCMEVPLFVNLSLLSTWESIKFSILLLTSIRSVLHKR